MQGRPSEGDGALFRYESLQAGETFEGRIVGPEALLEDLRGLLEQNNGGAIYRLGRSRKTQGRARFEVVALEPLRPEVPNLEGQAAVVRLESDALVVNKWGQCEASTEAFVHTLEQALDTSGLALASYTETEEGEEELMQEFSARKAFTSADVQSGFNAKWGLPTPPAPRVEGGQRVCLRPARGVRQSREGRGAPGAGPGRGPPRRTGARPPRPPGWGRGA